MTAVRGVRVGRADVAGAGMSVAEAMLGITSAQRRIQGDHMTELSTTASDPLPEPPVGSDALAPSHAVPLFSAPHHSDTTAATPNPVARNQFPTFLAPGTNAVPE